MAKNKFKVVGKKDKDPGTTTVRVCDLCDGPFKMSEEVLFCEGCCQKHLHRYCAGLSKSHYEELLATSTPFVCLVCTQQLHKAELKNLHEELAAVRSELCELRTALQTTVTASATNATTAIQTLETEVKELRTTVNSQAQNVLNYAQVLKLKSNKKSNKSSLQQLNHPKSRHNSHVKGSESISHATKPTTTNNIRRLCTPISGARKVWGTLRSTTVSAVKNAIHSVTNISINDLTIKRKFKTGGNDMVVRWWFVIRGDEATLQNLEDSWQQLSLQTQWRLEPVLCYSDVVELYEKPLLPVTTEETRTEEATTEDIATEQIAHSDSSDNAASSSQPTINSAKESFLCK